MPNRDRAEIIRQILEVANGAGGEGITKSKMMYRAFLSYKQLDEHLRVLIENDLLSYDSLTHTYKTTEKGFILLQLYNQLDDMIKKKTSQPPPRPRQEQEESA